MNPQLAPLFVEAVRKGKINPKRSKGGFAHRKVLPRLRVRPGTGGVDIPCPPCFLLAIKMNVTDGHIMRVFASHVHFYD